MSEDSAAGPIVVGISGSRSSQAALRWAAELASAARVPLIVVHAWQPSGALRAPYAPATGVPTEEDDLRAARLVLDTALRTAVTADLHIEVRPVLVRGRPVPTLLRYAPAAELLALGRRTVPDDGDPRLGPVARDCLTKAGCPVVTVPAGVVRIPPAPTPPKRRPVVAGR
ncbi:universal stress protein [Actinacidiphila alni]|uniref:universal stress protein n=1 Tax=Actinacidiphila alni TaxID=380248 RepID=UPI003452228A